jgi:hypothetical protein
MLSNEKLQIYVQLPLLSGIFTPVGKQEYTQGDKPSCE